MRYPRLQRTRARGKQPTTPDPRAREIRTVASRLPLPERTEDYTRANLNLTGMWLMVNEASYMLAAVAEGYGPRVGELRRMSAELEGMNEVIHAVKLNEAKGREQ